MQRIGSALVISLVGSSASADAPPVDRVVVDTVTVNGSGCPAGTAAVAVSPDNTAFTISYSSYIAQVGVGASPTDFRKNCNLNLIVHVPPGFTYAIAAVDYSGGASLAAGASAVLRTRLFFRNRSGVALPERSARARWGNDDEPRPCKADRRPRSAARRHAAGGSGGGGRACVCDDTAT